ncbi:MAG: RHS repeat-associated core domain-containing protein, partial [Pseudomarimonas sp.]
TGVTTATLTYAYDKNGNRETETHTGPTGTRSTRYAYDTDDRLIRTEATDEAGLATITDYTLDDVGNRKTEIVTTGSARGGTQIANKAYIYNARHQLTRVTDSVANLTTDYTWDGNGFMTGETETRAGQPSQTTTYRPNLQDRLDTLTTPTGPPVHYSYDIDGLRVEKRSTVEATRYGYDGTNLRRETNVTNNPLATYDWASGRILRTRRATSTSYAQHDALKSPIRWSLASGAEQGRATYTAWGETATSAGTLPPIGFGGYYADQESQSYYAQQRYYRPGLGRFNRIDPWQGDTNNPITLNKYLYANGNPLYYTDPTGMYGEAGHYYTTYIVARSLDISHKEASTLALYSQFPDEVGALDAINQPPTAVTVPIANALFGASAIPVAPVETRGVRNVQCGLHSLCGSSSVEGTRVSRELLLNAKTAESAGVAIHALGDSFSHRDIDDEQRSYSGPLGHLVDMHAPDEIHRRPELFKAYVAELATTLGQRMGKDVSAEEISAIQGRLMAGLDAAKQERSRLVENWERRTAAPPKLAPGAQLYWPVPTTEQRRASGYRGPSMGDLTIKQFALIAEEAANGEVLLRPERSAPGRMDHEGAERRNLRALYEANSLPLSDEAVSDQANRLDSAVDDLSSLRREIDEALR